MTQAINAEDDGEENKDTGDHVDPEVDAPTRGEVTNPLDPSWVTPWDGIL